MLNSETVSVDYVKSEQNLADHLTKPQGRNMILEHIKGNNDTRSNCKQTRDGNPKFVIRDPMNKVYMGKNKSLPVLLMLKLI